jgi:hypothetical protein
MPQLVPPHAATVRPSLRLDRKRFLDLSIEGGADTAGVRLAVCAL